MEPGKAATRAHKNLPNPGISILRGKKFSSHAAVSLGFGFDPNTSDFKLVRLLCFNGFTFHTLRTPKIEVKVEMYSKSTDYWRYIDAADLQCLVSESSPSAVVVRGKIHWLVTKLDGSDISLCFDLGNELFQEMSLPDFSEYLIKREPAVVSDSLAVIVYSMLPDFNKCIDVCVMKEYGVEQSWTKQLRIG